MPNMEKDPYSGAILFRPTTEEKQMSDLRNELTSMKDELAEKIAQVNEILNKAKK